MTGTNNVVSFIRAYKNRHPKEFLSDSGFERAVGGLKDEMDTLDPELQDALRTLLDPVLKELETRLDGLSARISQKARTLEDIHSNSAACIAYLNAAKGEKR